MNIINTHPIDELGYKFIADKYVADGLDEYYLRNIQNKKANEYISLTSTQIGILQSNANVCSNWQNVFVSPEFDASLVKNCKFYGRIRIGAMQPLFREFHNFKMPVGIYNSTIISCDFGDNVCVDNVQYLSHEIVGNDVMIANVGEIACTDHAKFGNGVLKEDEDEAVRTWVEVCNENGGRAILPFNGMLAGDAYMWSKYRADEKLMDRFAALTDELFDKKRGYYGSIGDRTVIKNCGILKDVWIGTDAYIKGANKIKNVTINSDENRHSQIGEGCELVNGIVGFGCRIFYGVKAVRFVLSSHSQLKYGARLINSYLGNNSTISCCEVLNSLIFPSHEQHHNNSFLCAALVMGQSNMAAGATIGSNHNSRSADGELIAGRGFWPGLCVSLKHNSKFASFTIIAKGDYPTELHVPLPFCLVSIDGDTGQTVVMPAYWFMYNMYAMERNAWKIKDRDKRTERIQTIEYDYLAPDTINEIFDAIKLLQSVQQDGDGNAFVGNWEAGGRITKIIKVDRAIHMYKELITFYAVNVLLEYFNEHNYDNFESFKEHLHATIKRTHWHNVGGQLIPHENFEQLLREIKNESISSWNGVHDFYRTEGKAYPAKKLNHAYCALLEIKNITGQQFTAATFKTYLHEFLATKSWMCDGIYKSRAKDYSNPFRKMVYDNNAEMDKVLGKLDNNSFIQDQLKIESELKEKVAALLGKL